MCVYTYIVTVLNILYMLCPNIHESPREKSNKKLLTYLICQVHTVLHIASYIALDFQKCMLTCIRPRS